MPLLAALVLAPIGPRVFPKLRRPVDAVLARPYTTEVPFGSSGELVWATNPQGWAFRDQTNLLYLTNSNLFDLVVTSGDAAFNVERAQSYPSHVHMVGKSGMPLMVGSASFTYGQDHPDNPLSKPFRREKRWTNWSSGKRQDWYAAEFGGPRRLTGLDVYFFDDAPTGECRAPDFVEVQRREGEAWVTIPGTGTRPKAGRNHFAFAAPVTTAALRLASRNQGERGDTGIQSLKAVGSVPKTASSPLVVTGDKWITNDDVVTVRLTVTNPTRKAQPLAVRRTGGDMKLDIQGYPLYVDLGGESFRGQIAPGQKRTFTFAAAVGRTEEEAQRKLDRQLSDQDPLARQIREYQAWFDANGATFASGDERTNRMFAHRLYNLKKNSMYPRLGRLNHRAFAEGRWRADWYANVISYGAGHQVSESRWLRDPSYTWGQLQTFTDNPRPDGIYPSHVNPKGERGGKYTDWITASAWDAQLVHPDRAKLAGMADALANNARGWRKVYGWNDDPLLVVDDHWWTGMEWQPSFFSFNGYRTDREDALRRVDLTAYNYGNERAVMDIMNYLGRKKEAQEFQARSAQTWTAVMNRMWNPHTKWFHSLRASDGQVSPTKEIIGIYPFAFGLFGERESLEAWRTLLDPAQFWTKWPLASASKDCPAYAQNGWPIGPGGSGCMWNGPSWPHANSLVMNAMAKTLRRFPNSPLRREHLLALFDSFTRAQFREGQPWTGEYYNGDTGEWKTNERDYNHSTWIDPLVSDLVGIVPRNDEVLEVDPLIPEKAWGWWVLDGQAYRGHNVTIAWDPTGRHAAKGFNVYVDGKRRHHGERLQRVTMRI